MSLETKLSQIEELLQGREVFNQSSAKLTHKYPIVRDSDNLLLAKRFGINRELQD
jgi:hypothetical protein